ncbi:ABC transporter substrate-binding protein [Microbacterium sp. 18062]|uniref:ABC transporter substrate-binding protein n=1 Tax=Microbacterium sp. 18062 TaxID=2681410 RepID=UPI0013585C06|nr:ABC transporter substrate-binding protein [Microbacterium sp. 18062]
MRSRTRSAAIAVVASLAVGLTACAPDDVDRVVPGSALTVAQSAPVTSLNPAVLGQDTAADAGLATVTNSGFWREEPTGERVAQERFGSIRVDSDDPFTVTYTVHEGVRWSDGAPVDAADLLLAWAVGTTHRTGGDPDAEGRPATRWDTGAGRDRGLDLVTEVPEVGGDGRSITLVYDSPVADGEAAFDVLPVSAHGTVMLGHPGEYDTADDAKQALIAAVRDDDLDWLAPVSRAFREDYVLDGSVPPEAAIGNGAYLFDRAGDDGSVELHANPDFVWGPSARIERLTVRSIPDADARAAAVASGEIDVAAVPATAEAVETAEEAAGHRIAAGTAFDHIDLQTAGGGVFDPATYGGDETRAQAVRAAFLATVPRDAMLAELVTPYAPDATVRASAVRAPDPVAADDAVSGADAEPVPTATGSADDPDIARAMDLLAEANVPDPTVRLLFGEGDARRTAAFARIAASAAEAGIVVVDVSRADWAAALAGSPTAYDAALFAWDADPSAPLALAAGFDTAGAQNLYGWSDERVDGLVAEAGAQTDAASLDAVLADLDAAIADHAWTLPLFAVPIVTLWSDAVAEVPAASGPDGVLAAFSQWMPTGVRGTGSPTPRDSVSPG